MKFLSKVELPLNTKNWFNTPASWSHVSMKSTLENFQDFKTGPETMETTEGFHWHQWSLILFFFFNLFLFFFFFGYFSISDLPSFVRWMIESICLRTWDTTNASAATKCVFLCSILKGWLQQQKYFFVRSLSKITEKLNLLLILEANLPLGFILILILFFNVQDPNTILANIRFVNNLELTSWWQCF